MRQNQLKYRIPELPNVQKASRKRLADLFGDIATINIFWKEIEYDDCNSIFTPD